MGLSSRLHFGALGYAVGESVDIQLRAAARVVANRGVSPRNRNFEGP